MSQPAGRLSVLKGLTVKNGVSWFVLHLRTSQDLLADEFQKQPQGNEILLSDKHEHSLIYAWKWEFGRSMRLMMSLFYRKISLLLTSLLPACSFHSKFNRLKYHFTGKVLNSLLFKESDISMLRGEKNDLLL